MAYLKRISCLASLVAAAAVGSALPVYAETEAPGADIVLEAATPAMLETETSPEAVIAPEAVAETIPDAETVAEIETSPVAAAEEISAETPTAATLLVETPVQPTFQISDDNLLSFEEAGLQAALDTTATEAAITEGVELAQSSRRRGYSVVSPAYLGVAGNLGFGDPDSAIGDFAFNVISKISLGPRFSLRPGFFISERFTNFAIPLTYNFNTLRAGGFTFQPYLGAGVDVPFNGNTALMLNAGADVPISRDFTLNSAANFRVTSGFGVGFSLGVGYNFPFIFE